jgi:hypothetical protein
MKRPRRRMPARNPGQRHLIEVKRECERCGRTSTMFCARDRSGFEFTVRGNSSLGFAGSLRTEKRVRHYAAGLLLTSGSARNCAGGSAWRSAMNVSQRDR